MSPEQIDEANCRNLYNKCSTNPYFKLRYARHLVIARKFRKAMEVVGDLDSYDDLPIINFRIVEYLSTIGKCDGCLVIALRLEANSTFMSEMPDSWQIYLHMHFA